jgi:acetyl esterase/lipase
MKKYGYTKELRGPIFGTGKFSLTHPFSKLYSSRSYAIAKKMKPILGVKRSFINVEGYEKATLGCYIFEAAEVDQNAPTIVYLHGGGFFGEIGPVVVRNACFFANDLKCKVFMPEYRTAYKYKFPIPAEDCYYAVKYIYENAAKLGVNTKRFVIYGDSAGGCLSAAVTIMARERKDFNISYQMLIYPVTDYLQQGESLKKYPKTVWSSHATAQMWDIYLGDNKPKNIGYASPLHAEDLSKLPPAYIEPQEIDCLCDDGIAYAQRLKAAGVPTTLNVLKGSYHGFEVEFDKPFVQKALKNRSDIIRQFFNIE